MKKWIWGIAVIVVALLACILIPLVDNDAETKPDIAKAMDGAKEGIEIIKDGDK